MISDDVLNEVYEKPKNGCCHNSWADIRSSLFHLHNMKTISGTPAWLEHLKMLLLMWKTSLTDVFLLEEHHQCFRHIAIFFGLLLSLKTHALTGMYTPTSNMKQRKWVTHLCQHLHRHEIQCEVKATEIHIPGQDSNSQSCLMYIRWKLTFVKLQEPPQEHNTDEKR